MLKTRKQDPWLAIGVGCSDMFQCATPTAWDRLSPRGVKCSTVIDEDNIFELCTCWFCFVVVFFFLFLQLKQDGSFMLPDLQEG